MKKETNIISLKSKTEKQIINAYIFLLEFTRKNQIDISEISKNEFFMIYAKVISKFHRMNQEKLMKGFIYIYLRRFYAKPLLIWEIIPKKEDIPHHFSKFFFLINDIISQYLIPHDCMLIDFVLIHSKKLNLCESEELLLIEKVKEIEKNQLKIGNYRAMLSVLFFRYVINRRGYWIKYFKTTPKSFKFYSFLLDSINH